MNLLVQQASLSKLMVLSIRTAKAVGFGMLLSMYRITLPDEQHQDIRQRTRKAGSSLLAISVWGAAQCCSSKAGGRDGGRGIGVGYRPDRMKVLAAKAG